MNKGRPCGLTQTEGIGSGGCSLFRRGVQPPQQQLGSFLEAHILPLYVLICGRLWQPGKACNVIVSQDIPRLLTGLCRESFSILLPRRQPSDPHQFVRRGDMQVFAGLWQKAQGADCWKGRDVQQQSSTFNDGTCRMFFALCRV